MPAAKGQDVQVWKKVFQELIHEVRPWHQWTLTLDNSLVPNDLQPGWTQYQQQVFARFTCSWCSRNWASAQVQVLCHMHWNKRESTGQVKMRIFAQRCQKCSEPPFEVPEFTEENVSRILNNLVFRILKKCYGERFKSMEDIPTLKDISLKGPHDTDNCEACLQGFCAQCELDLVKPSPMSPSLPTRRDSTPTSGVPINKPSLTRSSTTVDATTGHTGVKTGGGVINHGFPEPPQAKSPRANTSCRAESIVEVYSPRAGLDCHSTQNGRRCNFKICCCSITLILIIVVVVVVVVVVKTTI
ncbi:receptor-transporting protein 3 [Pipistrellus kuhlii]|uniref:Receptor transporter protein 3 n=1 Tax=Pipistrellus kuhlii TaxID=59472 RepID=A0A7J7R304_PIPKU|nr:receptor-transporting protein 3 [Pipistrellus kuhlii]KAF6270355.1 receptor transporter protein 3 [Pipistrellus kuhlii]